MLGWLIVTLGRLVGLVCLGCMVGLVSLVWVAGLVDLVELMCWVGSVGWLVRRDG